MRKHPGRPGARGRGAPARCDLWAKSVEREVFYESATGPILESALRKIGGDGDVPLAVLHVPQGHVSEQSWGVA